MDHTVLYVPYTFEHFLCESGEVTEVPSWARKVHIYLGNISSTNKNCYTWDKVGE